MPPPRHGSAALPFALVGCVFVVDLLWWLLVGSTGSLAYGLIDEPAHLATCLVALSAAAMITGSRPAGLFIAGALVACIAIDLDHIPGYLGSHVLSGEGPRPYSHSAVFVAALFAIGWASRRRDLGPVAFGLSFGVAAHLFRDLGTGPGVQLLWPASDSVFAVPYPAFAAGLTLLASAAVFARAAPVRSRLAWTGAVFAVAAVAVLAVPSTSEAAQRIGLGAYVPGAEEEPALLDAYAANVGQQPLIVASYEDWARPLIDPVWLDAVWARGAVPMVTWEPWSWNDPSHVDSLAAIAAGAYDTYLRSSAQAAAAWGRPLLVRFAHEMNGSWYPWGRGVNGNTPRAYVAAWRHVVRLFRDNGAANVKWVWVPYVKNGDRFPFRRFFPGDRWVDWVGLDGFNGGSIFGWRPFAKIFDDSYRELTRMTTRPVVLSEVGSSEQGGDKAGWLRRALGRAVPRLPRVRAILWWSSDDPRGDFRVDSSPGALAALREAISAPLYRSSREALLAVPPRASGSAAVASAPRASSRLRRVALGVYLPHAFESPRLIDRFSRMIARKPVIVSTYKQWRAQPFVNSELTDVWKRGALPMITWEPWKLTGRGFPLRTIAAGRYDAYLRRSARAAAAWERPVLVRFAHEMNGGWYPWGRGKNGNTPATYKRAWRHVVRIFRRHGADNVSWIWAPNVNTDGRYPFRAFFPGDRWVDWVGLDGFNWGRGGEWQSFRQIFASSYRTLTRVTERPMMVTETSSGPQGGNKAAWISAALRREIPRFPAIRAVVWFNEPFNGVDARVDSSRASLRAFRSAVRHPAYRIDRNQFLAVRLHFPAWP